MSRNPRILIVDDEPNVRLVFRTALEIVRLRHRRGRGRPRRPREPSVAPGFDLVLLDLQMPGMDGMEVAPADPGRRASSVPVVIVTAHGSIPRRRRGR